MTHPEELPGALVADLNAMERALLWCFRAGPGLGQEGARLQIGLAAVVAPDRAEFAAHLLRRILRQLALQSCRNHAVGAAGCRAVTWDEAAWLELVSTARSDPRSVRLWLRRLGLLRVDEALDADIVAFAAMLPPFQRYCDGGDSVASLGAPPPRPD